MSGRSKRAPEPTRKPSAPSNDLEATTFEIGGDEYVLFSYSLPTIALPDVLTPNELAVAHAAIEGKSNGEIARTRGTSTNTVANQLRSIYGKLGISGRGELLALALRSGSKPPHGHASSSGHGPR